MNFELFTGTILSIAFFNFAGVSVTKELSATTRMVLDSVRTLVIWLVSLAVLWQDFNYLQVIGFILLLIGMCLYNNILIVPKLERWGLLPSRRPGAVDISPPHAVFAPTPTNYSSDSNNWTVLSRKTVGFRKPTICPCNLSTYYNLIVLWSISKIRRELLCCNIYLRFCDVLEGTVFFSFLFFCMMHASVYF